MSELTKISDDELIRSCVAGDTKAQKLLFERYTRKMMGICMRYAGNKQEAEDMLQEGWIKIFRNLNTFRFEGSAEGWIKKVMVNTCLECLRKNKMQYSDVEIETIEEMGYLTSQDSLSANDLLKLVHRLPSGYRSVFNLFAVEGYSHKEIGKMLTISEGTSKSQFNRARMHLQKMLGKELKIVSHEFAISY